MWEVALPDWEEGPRITWDEGSVVYLGCADGSTGLYICQIHQTILLNGCLLLYVICTPLKLIFKKIPISQVSWKLTNTS